MFFYYNQIFFAAEFFYAMTITIINLSIVFLLLLDVCGKKIRPCCKIHRYIRPSLVHILRFLGSFQLCPGICLLGYYGAGKVHRQCKTLHWRCDTKYFHRCLHFSTLHQQGLAAPDLQRPKVRSIRPLPPRQFVSFYQERPFFIIDPLIAW